MTIRLGVCLLVLSTCTPGQFFSLATPSNGSRIYFATPLRQKNTAQPNYGKLFRFDENGLALQESREDLQSAHDLVAVDVSSDGLVLAAVAINPPCVGNPVVCSRAEQFATTITMKDRVNRFPGNLRLSANGEWAFGPSSNVPHFAVIFGYLYNLRTGELMSQGSPSVTQFRVAGSGRPVANDGTAVFSDIKAVVIVKGSQMQRIPIQDSEFLGDAVIDAGAQTIVYTVIANTGDDTFRSSRGHSLHVADATTLQSTALVSDAYAPSLTDDGHTVLYLSQRDGAPQAWLIRTDGSGDHKLTQDPLGIAQAVISGDGGIVYAVTLGGRLVHIDTASGEVRELLPRTPFINSSGGLAPGKLTVLKGVGLSDSTSSAIPPLPYSLGGVQVMIQGKAARISEIGPSAITILTPPDVIPTLPTESALISLEVSSSSPLEGPVLTEIILQQSPEFLFNGDRQTNPYVLAAHEDWSSLVTPDNPAHPSEVLHAYAVGLGPTSPNVPYGEGAPAREPLARLTSNYQCGSAPGNFLEVLFDGLAPNLAGVYQVDLRIPADRLDGDFFIECAINGDFSGFIWLAGFFPVRRK